MIYSKIAGTGRYLPERILTNADVEKLVKQIGFRVDDHVYNNFYSPMQSSDRRIQAVSLVVSCSRN